MRFFNIMGQASLCQLRVPALLQYLGHQAIAGVDLIVFSKGPLGFVARLPQY